jgi:hypothetical protein
MIQAKHVAVSAFAPKMPGPLASPRQREPMTRMLDTQGGVIANAREDAWVGRAH